MLCHKLYCFADCVFVGLEHGVPLGCFCNIFSQGVDIGNIFNL